MVNIPERLRDLLADETKTLLHLATTMPDGTPQVTPVWFDYDGEYVWINSARGRVKDSNMRARPHVACLIMDPHDDARYLQIRGEVVEITEEGALDHAYQLVAKYVGPDASYTPAGRRVIYKIRPDHVFPAK